MTRPRFELEDDSAAARGVSRARVAAGGGAPPGSASDRGGGGGGEPASSGPPVSTLAIGMSVLLGSLTMLFVGVIGAYVVLRFGAPEWPPAGAPEMPKGLYGSTAVILLSSVVLERARRAIRRGDARALESGIVATTVLGLAFLGLQAYFWSGLFASGLTLESDIYGALFYTLTGLHAAHVLGGIVLLVVVAARAVLGKYTREAHGAVGACAAYWHFLGAVWVVLFLMLVVFP